MLYMGVHSHSGIKGNEEVDKDTKKKTPQNWIFVNNCSTNI